MMKKQEGFLLLTTLFFLSLLGVFVFYCLQSLFLYYKGLNQSIEKRQEFYELEFQARLLGLSNWEQHQSCIISEQDPSQVIHVVRQQGCVLHYKNKSYRYLVEKLGIFPCLQILRKNLHYSTQHWRITLLNESHFLQLRIARQNKLLPCDKNTLKLIPLGIISWRYLDLAIQTIPL